MASRDSTRDTLGSRTVQWRRCCRRGAAAAAALAAAALLGCRDGARRGPPGDAPTESALAGGASSAAAGDARRVARPSEPSNGAPVATEPRGAEPPRAGPPSAAHAADIDLTPTSETLARAARIVRAGSIDAADGASVARQLGLYGELTRLGAPVVVRFPLVQASVGWGCACPNTYVGESPDTHNGGETWLDVRLEPDVVLPPGGRLGRVSLVEGIFTGQSTELDLRDDGEPPEWLYHPKVVRVLRVVRAHVEVGSGASMRAVRVYEAPERIACRTYVDDPDPPTRVRAEASREATVVGEVPNGTELGLVDFERGWLRIRAPLEGYVFGRMTRTACAGDDG